ncbi:Hypothetical predicted protein [Cloeon dipterum]|uniref:Chitin-binding type-2 domain-containing protein n=1 Tax=Cloeon dipterum TaxID=197152 RepID=A0A8S1DDN1_9INSE|nr:Hypothetical predicted protein [Cloeon dipterum]
MMKLKTLAGLLLFCCFAFSSAKSEFIGAEELESVLYEELGDGTVAVNRFESTIDWRSLNPIFGDFNPSPRLDSCSKLGVGRFPVLGDCGKFLECHAETNNTEEVTYTRRIVQCLQDFWFSEKSGVCGLKGDVCFYGRLVPASPAVHLAQRTLKPTSLSCTREGWFAQPGCTGFHVCRSTKYGLKRNEYTCGAGNLYDEMTQKCVSAALKIKCSVPLAEEVCLRPCIEGDNRVCSYQFIVSEHVSMSTVHCGNCPYNLDDCNLPGCISAGGLQRPLISINQQMPGPAIQVCKGDTIEVDVVNLLTTSAVTIHWHGLLQRATPFMDGVPYLTQCPISPGNSFLYRMIADEAGTHIYHSHIGHLDADGIHGALIVREQQSTEEGLVGRYDQDLPEHTILVWHWYQNLGEVQSLDLKLLSQRREGFGFLINGKGVVGQRFAANGKRRQEPITNYYVNSGTRYRFRVIFNGPLMCPIQISIDGHQLEILAVDGNAVQSSDGLVESVFLTAGERLDIVPLATVSTWDSAFYVRVRGLDDCNDLKNGVHQYAILRYDNYAGAVLNYPEPSYNSAIRPGRAFNLDRDIFNSVTQTRISADSLVNYNTALNRPDNLEGTPDKRFYVDASFNVYSESSGVQFVYPQLNNVTWASPSFPLLTQWQQITSTTLCTDQYNTPTGCEGSHCVCPNTLLVQTGDLVEIVLYDPRGPFEIGHPFHLHGFDFKVVGHYYFSGQTYYEEVKNLVENTNDIVKNPSGPWKDTVLLPGKALVLLRFRADNPGYWMFHCHIGEHAALGMALTFKVGEHFEMIEPPSQLAEWRCSFRQLSEATDSERNSFSNINSFVLQPETEKMPGKQADIPSMFDKMNRKRKFPMGEPSSPPSATSKRRHESERELKSPESKPSPRRSLRIKTLSEMNLSVGEKVSPLPTFTWGDHQTVWWNSMLVPDLKNNEARGMDMFDKNPEILPKMRSIMLDWLIEVAEVYKLRRETYYLAQDYVDRFLYLSEDAPKADLQLLGITCIFIAAKANEIYPPNVSDFAYVTDGACTEDAIIDHESYVLRILDWKVFIFTPTDWVSLFLQNSCRLSAPESKHKFEVPRFPTGALAIIASVLDLATLDAGCLKYSYSVLAASAIIFVYGKDLVLRACGIDWSDLTDCVTWMAKFAIALHVNGLVPIVGTNEIPSPPLLAFTTAPQDKADPNLLQSHRTTMELLVAAQQTNIHALNTEIENEQDASELPASSPEKVLMLERTPMGKQLEQDTSSLEMAPVKSVAVKSTVSPSYNPKELFQQICRVQ